jgi:hypothetical protein
MKKAEGRKQKAEGGKSDRVLLAAYCLPPSRLSSLAFLLECDARLS